MTLSACKMQNSLACVFLPLPLLWRFRPGLLSHACPSPASVSPCCSPITRFSIARRVGRHAALVQTHPLPCHPLHHIRSLSLALKITRICLSAFVPYSATLNLEPPLSLWFLHLLYWGALKMVLTVFGRQIRYHSPWVQNAISGIGVGASAGIYVALNLLGAGGGRPDSAHVVQVVNATLCSVWFFSSSFGGSILNKLGPGLTMCLGVQTYAVYVGSLWYYDEIGKTGYPYAAGPIIGVGAGMVFITAGYISTAYPEENEKGAYATMLMNMQGLGSVIGGIIPVVINRNKSEAAGVPRSVYASFIAIMVVGGLLTLLLQRPQKLRRDDGSTVAVHPARGAWEELKSNLLIFTDPILILMLPAFFPAEGFLVYSGSVNGR